jgi:hypothetical protein
MAPSIEPCWRCVSSEYSVLSRFSMRLCYAGRSRNKMNCPFNDDQLVQLKGFVELCKTTPQILNHPKLSFFKDYLASLGVTIPAATFGATNFTPAGDS